MTTWSSDNPFIEQAELCDRERALDDIALLMWRFEISASEVDEHLQNWRKHRRLAERPDFEVSGPLLDL